MHKYLHPSIEATFGRLLFFYAPAYFDCGRYKTNRGLISLLRFILS